jgi:hypothetical protein
MTFFSQARWACGTTHFIYEQEFVLHKTPQEPHKGQGMTRPFLANLFIKKNLYIKATRGNLTMWPL